MSIFFLALKSFRFYLKSNLLVAAGVAVSTAVLTGALLIGDSLRYSLRQITLARLGNTAVVVSAGERYFTKALAGSLSRETGVPVAPILMLNGTAVSGGGEKRVNDVQISGTDPAFEAISGLKESGTISDDEIIISDNLARKLEAGEGDAILLRISRITPVPGNAPFVSEGESTVPFRATIRKVISPREMGNFSLRNSQLSRDNIFMSLDKLNRLMDTENRVNRLLVAGNPSGEEVSNALRKNLRPEDAGLEFKNIPLTGESEISTDRVFLEKNVTGAYRQLSSGRVIMSWLINRIQFKGNEVPYSFAASWPGAGLGKHEILVNSWLAGDLGLKPGDTVTVSYFRFGVLRQLTEKSLRLKVKQVVPLAGPYADRDLAPRVPGLYDAGHCRDWQAGVPVDLSKIRDRDEDYWNVYKGTPKLFVSPELADSLWSNRFGNATAIRFPQGEFSHDDFIRIFREKLHPAGFGFDVQPVRETGLTAASNGVDFGQLFMGLSFFLLLAAILLTGVLFRLNLDSRSSQTGTLLQLGFTRKDITGIMLPDAFIVAMTGMLTGLLLAVLYVGIIFRFLDTLWWDIVRTPMLFLHIKPVTLIMGAGLSLLVALLALIIPLRQFMKRTVVFLQRNKGTAELTSAPLIIRTAAPLPVVAAVLLVIYQVILGGTGNPVMFFLSGALMLTGLLLFSVLIIRNTRVKGEVYPALNRLWIRNVVRDRKRSLTIILVFALATFIVLSTGANRRKLVTGPEEKTSGTGGFSLYAETTVPVLFDLNDAERRRRDGIDTTFRIVQFSRIEGDDASCLNLNRTSNPSILGVDGKNLTGRFSFVTHTGDVNRQNPWISLKEKLQGEVYQAYADQTVIQWGLGLKPGDTLLYQAENGDTLRLKLTGGILPSVFQGNVLIDESVFIRFFPSHSGSSVFLAESASAGQKTVSDQLQDWLRDNGIEITPAVERLAEFNSITETYLSIFFALGILALLLGTTGLSVILARSVLERRRELAIISAVGFPKRMIAWQMVAEYGVLLAWGAGIGAVSSFSGLIPAWISGSGSTPVPNQFFLLLLIILHGLAWIAALAAMLIKPVKLLPSLNSE